MEAVETICPGASAFSISGPKISTPRDYRHQIDAERPIPQRVVPHPIWPAAADTGVVDEDVDGAEALDRRVRRRLQFALQRHVSLDAGDLGVARLQRLDRPRECRLFDVAEHDPRAGAGERLGYAEPDARRRAGDKRDLA